MLLSNYFSFMIAIVLRCLVILDGEPVFSSESTLPGIL